VAEGVAEGVASDLPAQPQWSGEWQLLGKPDLVVTLPQPYTLAAEGRDVYRNFVIPVRVAGTRYVKGVELRPGNPKIVHHAFIKVDRAGESRRRDAEDAESGFAGMNTPAEMPDGHFLGWQPGRLPTFVPDGLAWRLDVGNDLVLQTHLTPSGKPEILQLSIGLYFTDQPPTNTCFKLALTSLVVDIPAGAQDYVVEDSFVLPVDAQVLAVLPHAHYLAREMQGWATRPDGTKEWLCSSSNGTSTGKAIIATPIRSLCPRAASSRCVSATTTRRTTSVTRIIPQSRLPMARRPAMKWLSCGSNYCRETRPTGKRSRAMCVKRTQGSSSKPMNLRCARTPTTPRRGMIWP
jgi:hypothetical protein